MSSLPERALDVPLEDLAPLTYEAGIWLDGEASTKYIRAKQIPRLASDLFTLPSKVLMDGAAKAMVLPDLHLAKSALPDDLIDWVHDVGRVVTSMDNRVDLLRKEVQRLKEGGDPNAVAVVEAQASEAQSLADNLQIELDEASRHRESMEMDQLQNARTQVRQMETELLELSRSKDALRVDLPRQAIEDYKKTPGFEMGLVQMGQVYFEYGYQLALVRLRAQHPELEIEQDPFALLPEDADIPMADEQPFNDSPPPPEE
ncbi:hypothetical protein BHE74_00040974 [Ensete ventricosum]|nr:hypothetical protein BHE74_00040974 [Ensete ventricosum]